VDDSQERRVIRARPGDPEFRRAWITRIHRHDGWAKARGKASGTAGGGAGIGTSPTSREFDATCRRACDSRVDAYRIYVRRVDDDAWACPDGMVRADLRRSNRSPQRSYIRGLDSATSRIFSWKPCAGAARFRIRLGTSRRALHDTRLQDRAADALCSSATYCGASSTIFHYAYVSPGYCRRCGTDSRKL